MIHENVHPPVRSNPSDAGLDLRWSPEDASVRGLRISPGESKLLPTGCKFAIPHGYMLEIKNRSSMAARKHLIVGAHVVDSGYEGEVFVNLHNIGKNPQTVRAGDKIAQAVVVPVIPVRFVETQSDNLYNWYPISISDRADGALGSTDKK